MSDQEYVKIHSIYKRDQRGAFLPDAAQPEFAYLYENQWDFTEKVDGTNVRVMWTESGIKFGGRTANAQMPTFLFDRLTELFADKADVLEPGSVLYGEGYGARIQKGGGNYMPDRVDFVAFDAFIGGLWLERVNVDDLAATLGVRSVPLIGRGTLFDAEEKCRAGFNSEWGDFRAEGLVARPITELLNRRGQRIITKVKCRDYDRGSA